MLYIAGYICAERICQPTFTVALNDDTKQQCTGSVHCPDGQLCKKGKCKISEVSESLYTDVVITDATLSTLHINC